MTGQTDHNVPVRRRDNVPFLALGSAAVFLAFGVLALVFVDTSDTDKGTNLAVVIGLVVTTVPSLVAAAFAERASRDIRNGTVTAKAKEGTRQALDETGVTEVAHNALATTPESLTALRASNDALALLLAQNTNAQNTNTGAVQTNTDAVQTRTTTQEGSSDG